LQREFVRDADLFGNWQAGTPAHPALVLQSVHHLKKHVNGVPLVRPWWSFDPDTAGEAMADVGTHLADLAIWLVSPDQAVDYATQIRMLAADRTPLVPTGRRWRASISCALPTCAAIGARLICCVRK